MDSSDGHSDASGGSGRETRRMKEAGASRIKAPKWNCTKSAFSEWCWESEPVWDAKGMHNTYTGANRSEMDSERPKNEAVASEGAPTVVASASVVMR